jgi:hypothetical protein
MDGSGDEGRLLGREGNRCDTQQTAVFEYRQFKDQGFQSGQGD